MTSWPEQVILPVGYYVWRGLIQRNMARPSRAWNRPHRGHKGDSRVRANVPSQMKHCLALSRVRVHAWPVSDWPTWEWSVPCESFHRGRLSDKRTTQWRCRWMKFPTLNRISPSARTLCPSVAWAGFLGQIERFWQLKENTWKFIRNLSLALVTSDKFLAEIAQDIILQRRMLHCTTEKNDLWTLQECSIA